MGFDQGSIVGCLEVAMTYTSLYGQIIGRQQVEAAVLSTLRVWMVAYIAEVERQNGLAPRTIPTPPTSESYHGGLDFDTWRQGLEPVLIVLAQPVDDAEHRGSGEYGQWYDIQVGAICVADQKFYDVAAVNQVEDSARLLGDIYGAAVLGVLTQQFNNDIEPWIGRTELVMAPETEFISDEVPSVTRSVCQIRTLIFPVVDGSQGPTTVPSDPYGEPGLLPGVSTTNLTFEAVPLDEEV